MSGKKELLIMKIGSKEYEIIYQHPVVDNNERVWGYIDYSQCKIYIDNTNCEDVQFTTLIHEILHACLQEVGSPMNREEDQVDSLANILGQVIKDNRDILE